MSAWTIVSIMALAAAAVMLLRGEHNAAFVAGALGAVAWFLNYRGLMRQTIRTDEGAGADEHDEDEDADDVYEGDASGDDD